jgi:hypothetical protein
VPYNCVVLVVRIHDSQRRPASWTEIIKAGQFVAFAKDVESGAPCDQHARPFADAASASCIIFDSLPEASAFCETAVARAEALQFDVFDSQGRAHSPLLTIVHPSRVDSQETHPRALARRQLIAWVLMAAGIPLIVYAYVKHTEREIILPAFVGINMLIAAGRLLWLNLGIRETERERLARLKHAGAKDARRKNDR